VRLMQLHGDRLAIPPSPKGDQRLDRVGSRLRLSASAPAMGRECVSFAGSRGGSARVRGWLDFVSGRRCHIKNL